MAEDESTETEDATETATETETTDSATEKPDSLGDAGKQAIDRMKKERDDARKEAKANAKALETERAKGLSDSEKAIAQAKADGAAEATLNAGKRLARAEIKAAAAGKGIDASKQLDYLDMTRFVGDDGEPNVDAISEWVGTQREQKPNRPAGNVDQGVRTSPSLADQVAAAEAKGDWKTAGQLKAQQLQAAAKS